MEMAEEKRSILANEEKNTHKNLNTLFFVFACNEKNLPTVERARIFELTRKFQQNDEIC